MLQTKQNMWIYDNNHWPVATKQVKKDRYSCMKQCFQNRIFQNVYKQFYLAIWLYELVFWFVIRRDRRCFDT